MGDISDFTGTLEIYKEFSALFLIFLLSEIPNGEEKYF